MKNVLTVILGTGLLLGSCTKDFEEINTNPNLPEDYLPTALFNANNQALMYNLRGYDNIGKQTLTWMQYTSQPIYTKESRYLLDPNGASTLYFQGYKRAMGYKKIIEYNTDPATQELMKDYGKNANQIAAARVMLAYTFSIMVQSFGDIPYYSFGDSQNPNFQALQTDKYVTPAYASQKEIYYDLLKELEAAIAQIDVTDTRVFSEGDFLFRTPQKLKKFAYSLRLRIANHLKGATAAVLGTELKQKVDSIISHYESATQVQLENELLGDGDSIELSFENNYTFPAPAYYDYFIGNRVDYLPSSNFVKLLAGNNKKAQNRGLSYGVDPRMEKYFATKNLDKWDIYYGYTLNDLQPIDTTKYVGMPYGMQESDVSAQYKGGEAVSFFSKEILSSSAKEVLMDYSEVCFILSEIRNWNNDFYKAGVKASLERWGVPEAKKTAFLASLPAANEENVLTQKYISLFRDPDEAWVEYRRTGYPKTLLTLGERVRANLPATNPYVYQFRKDPSATDVIGIPDRMNYPDTYTGVNKDSYIQALNNMQNPQDLRSKRLIFATRP